jgi:hypothetical protein
MSDIPFNSGGDSGEKIIILQPTKPEDVPKRGRPRTKVQPAEVRTQPSTTQSSAPISSQLQKNEEERRRLLNQKKHREVDEYQKKIITEFNDQLIEAFVALGFPGEFFYTSGSPKKLAKDPNYTDLANGIMINDLQAGWIAHGLVEIKYIPAIQKLMIGSNPDGPSYFWIAMGALGIFSYASTLVTTMKKLREIMATLENIKNATPPQPEYNGPTFSEANFEGAAPIFEGS